MNGEIIWHWDVIIYHVADVIAAAIRFLGFCLATGLVLHGMMSAIGRGK